MLEEGWGLEKGWGGGVGRGVRGKVEVWRAKVGEVVEKLFD